MLWCCPLPRRVDLSPLGGLLWAHSIVGWAGAYLGGPEELWGLLPAHLWGIGCGAMWGCFPVGGWLGGPVVVEPWVLPGSTHGSGQTLGIAVTVALAWGKSVRQGDHATQHPSQGLSEWLLAPGLVVPRSGGGGGECSI